MGADAAGAAPHVVGQGTPHQGTGPRQPLGEEQPSPAYIRVGAGGGAGL